MKDEVLENNIVSLHARGWSIRRLSREFAISRGRVSRVLQRNSDNRQKGVDQLSRPAKRASKLDPYKDYISELLERHKNPPITNQRVFELLLEKGYTGKMSILRDYLARVRGKKRPEPVECVETLPGQRASHDWSDYYIRLTDQAGEEKITFFSCILNYSRYQYLEVVGDKTQATLLRCLVNAFVYFDGVPLEIKSDNQKACVDQWEAGRPVFNRHFLSFATHYRFRPLAIRPGKPRENLKVERPFYYLETNFLNGRIFRDKQDLKDQLQDWLTEKNSRRIHRTTARQPIELYRKELPFLQVLPARQYDTSIIEYRIVNNESAVQWADYYYMVPPRYMYETCPVRVSEREIIIYSPDCREIARHELAEKDRKDRYVGRGKTANKHTLPAKQVAERLEAFGPVVQEYIGELKTRKPKGYLYHWRHILALKAVYRVEDIIMAVKRALKYRIFEAQAIEKFLQVNAEKRSEIIHPLNTSDHE